MNTNWNEQKTRHTVVAKQKSSWALTLAASLMVGASLAPAVAAPVTHGVSAGLIRVTQLAPTDDNTAGLSLDMSVNDFRLSTGGNRADYNVQIGPVRTDDAATGVLISSVAENGRNNFGTNAFCIATVYGTAGYAIASFTGSGEYNINVAGALFPYSKFYGGYLVNGANNGPITNFVGHPGLSFANIYTTNGLTSVNGRGILDLHSVGVDSADGILLTVGGKDENNYALSMPIASNGTWMVFCKDIGATGAGSGESDGIGFVYIPRTNTDLVMGRFYGNGTIDMYNGASPQFSVTAVGGGRWSLKIPGYSPTNGVLIISGEGGTSQNQDNIVSYQPNAAGDGWDIQSRDTPGNGLQTPGSGTERVASFVFIPAETPGFKVTPTNNLLTTEAVGSATFTVALDRFPKGDVTINLASDNTAEGLVSPSSLTFTTNDWSIPQTVTITGQDDGNTDGSVNYHIILSPATSTDSVYNGLDPQDVNVVNADNEVGVTVSKTLATTTEAGGTDTFTIRLNTQPADGVVINLSSSDLTEGTVSPSSLLFTGTDWDQPQTVTVTGVSDPVDDGNVSYTIVTDATLSNDPNYAGIIVPDVGAINVDDDTASVLFSRKTGLNVSEAGTSTNFTVVLTSQPTANVTVNLTTSDSSEGIITPSVSFTTSDWSTPKTVTLTGVNDSVNDGDISYTVDATVSSSDPVYAAVTASASAKTFDNEAQLTLSGTLIYSSGTPGTAIDPTATIVDADTADYNGGTLTVTLTAGATADDRIEIRNAGTAAGQIGVSGNTITYEGITIGTFSGGTGSSPLVINFSGAATPVAAQALIRSITFRNVNANTPLTTRTVSVTLNDGDGGTSTASKGVQLRFVRVFNYQEGADYGYGTYFGETDIELNGVLPDNNFPAGSTSAGLWIGAQTSSGVLLRFDNILGNGPMQIPTNAIIVSADLVLNVSNGGHGSPLYRMTTEWDGTNATYNGTGSGTPSTQPTYDSIWGVPDLSGGTGGGAVEFSVTADLQVWANGTEPNYGWWLPGWPFSADSTAIAPGESTDVSVRPLLRVKWVPAGTQMVSFRQGVNGYAEAKDTRIGEDAPDSTAFATSAALFVDGEVTGGNSDQAQVLMRFDSIVGPAATQIPAGATIHAAVLDFASLVNNAMGDGGAFYALTKPWDVATTTWNTWSGQGIVVGSDTLPTATAAAGSAALNPDVQGGYLTYEVTSDVQAWVNNVRPNYGWAILPWNAGGNGWGIAMSEATTERERPQLRVYFSAGSGVATSLLTPTVTSSSVTVKFTGQIGNTYSVQRSATVNGPYTTIGTATVQGDGKATYIDNSPLPNTAFYRVSNP